MSYVQTMDAFSPSQIEELSMDEIDQVSGGLPILVVAAIVVGGVIVVGFVAGAVAGYVANS